MRSAGGMCVTPSERMATITAMNDSPFSVKHIAAPSAASVAPARSDPTIRERLNWIEFSAIALGRSFLLTSDGTSD